MKRIYTLAVLVILAAYSLAGTSAFVRATATPSPAANAGWMLTGSMSETRAAGATATRMTDGRVLVVGGSTADYAVNDEPTSLASAEIYDPTSKTWSESTPMSVARDGHIAALLPSGRVLVAGGESKPCLGCALTLLASAEIYDPVSNSWSGTLLMHSERFYGAAVTLGDGTVLVTGGYSHNNAY